MSFEILIDRLRNGGTEKIDAAFEPTFLGIEEKELLFPQKVKVSGQTYIAEDHLILQLKTATQAKMPCKVCNRMIEIDLELDNFYHTQPLDEIPSGVFDYTEALREAILIELPPYVECNRGNCPERQTLAPYLNAKKQENKTYFPFADIDLN
jgi:uncharacterized metal-binding protein YceD (DUF177 family)